MMTNISKHGAMRMRQRMGIPKKATQRIAERAFERGLKREDAKGAVRKWMNDSFYAYGTGDNMRMYGDKLYIFCDNTLVTVLQVPTEIKDKAQILKKKVS